MMGAWEILLEALPATLSFAWFPREHVTTIAVVIVLILGFRSRGTLPVLPAASDFTLVL